MIGDTPMSRRRVDVKIESTALLPPQEQYNFSVNAPAKLSFPRSGTKDALTKADKCDNVGRVILAIVLVLVLGGALFALVYVIVTSGSTTPASAPVSAPTTAPTAPPAVVSSGTPHVRISFVCNHVLTGADAGFCLGVFSYNNTAGHAVTVPIGADNYMAPGPLSPTHPTTFVDGWRFGAVTSRWHCSVANTLTWVVRSGTGVSVASTPATHTECPPLPL